MPGAARPAILLAFGGGADDGDGSASPGGGGGGVVAMHFVGAPPSLTEQVLPVALPGVTSLDGVTSPDGGGGGGGSGGACVADIAFDPSGRRLAVALRAPHPAAGLVALYSASAAPVVRAELVGFARPFARGYAAAGLAFAQKLAKGGGGGGEGGGGAGAGAGAGAVLSVMAAGERGAVRVANIALAI